MSDTERVRAWRQRLKDGGLVPMTIWVNPETQARYQDLAARSHRSGSELVQLALDAYRLDPAAVAASVTDIEQIRTIIRDELDQTTAIITATVTSTVAETLTAMLPALVQAAMPPSVSDTVTATEPETAASAVDTLAPSAVSATVTERATDAPPTPHGRRAARGPARRRKALTRSH
jgi:hypothetical protein